MSEEPTVSPGRIFLALMVALFVVGFLGWLVQGAGDDATVPTAVPTTGAPPTIDGP